MAYSIDEAFYEWVTENPDFTASSALEPLYEICSDYYIREVNIDEVEYRGIKGGSKKAYGSGMLSVDLLYGSGRTDDTGTRMKFSFPFVFEFLLDQTGKILKAEKLEMDFSNFTG
jgi:hypothetical protein